MQEVHAVEAVAPTSAEEVPGAHDAQLEADKRYEPAGQLVLQLADPADEKEDCQQTIQLETNEAPVELRYLPAAQFVQAEEPIAVPYVPAPQFEHDAAAAVEY